MKKQREGERKEDLFLTKTEQSLLTDNIQKKKRDYTHTHVQTDKNSICDFIKCGFFIA
jgi:hypothetical protein